MAIRHSLGESHACLSPNLQPVVGLFVSMGKSASITGVQTGCRIHGCLCHLLGCHIQRECSIRDLNWTSNLLANQLAPVSSSMSCTEPLKAATGQSRIAPYGQHCDSTSTIKVVCALVVTCLVSEASEVTLCQDLLMPWSGTCSCLQEDSQMCSISAVFSFLQHRLEWRLSPSTPKCNLLLFLHNTTIGG